MCGILRHRIETGNQPINFHLDLRMPKYKYFLSIWIPLCLFVFSCSSESGDNNKEEAIQSFTVNYTTPSEGNKNISPNASITAWFSSDIDPNGYDTSSAISLLLNGARVPGNFIQNGPQLVFTPLNPLEQGKTYTVVIQSGIRGEDGSVMNGDYLWSFEVQDMVTEYLKIVSTTPAANSTGVETNANISISFDQQLDPTKYANSILVQQNNTDISGQITIDYDRLIFNPIVDLEAAATYKVTLRSNLVESMNGLSVNGNYVWYFTTISPQACSFDGTEVANGDTVTAFLQTEVEEPAICQSETRTCSNGNLSGSYAFSSCSVKSLPVAGDASCTFNGQEISHGSSVLAYLTETISAGEFCQPEARICSNGTLSGSYDYSTCSSQVAQNTWVKQFGPSSGTSLNARAIEIDNSGNSYITGNDGSLAYIKKLDSEGKELWTKTNEGEGRQIAINSSVLYWAYYNDETCNIEKLDLNGNRYWKQQFIADYVCYTQSLDLDQSGNLILAGMASGNLNGTKISGYYTIPRMFLSEISSNGEISYIVTTGMPTSSERESSYDVSVDQNDNIYLVGQYANYYQFSGTTYVGCNGGLYKFTSGGSLEWFQETQECYVEYLAVEVSNSAIYVVGKRSGNFYLFKYNINGQFSWKKSIPTTMLNYTSDDNTLRELNLEIDSNENIYVVGTVSADFDGESRIGGNDILLTKFSSAGLALWTRLIGTAEDDYGRDLRLDSSGNIYVTGHTSGSLDGTSNQGFTTQGMGFVMKLNSFGLLQ